MAEDFVLATAETASAIVTTTYRLIGLALDWEHAYISIRLRGANGEIKTFSYGGDGPGVNPAAVLALLVALNKADLSVKSLQRRILERLIADGKILGTISGTPD